MKCKSSKICTNTALDGDEKMEIIRFEFDYIFSQYEISNPSHLWMVVIKPDSG